MKNSQVKSTQVNSEEKYTNIKYALPIVADLICL